MAPGTSVAGRPDTATAVARCSTVTAAVPCTDPLDAVIVAVPLATAVTVAVAPALDTVAMDGALDVHVSTAALSVAPEASFATAVTVRVSPNEAMTSGLETVSTMDATPAGTLGPSFDPLHAANSKLPAPAIPTRVNIVLRIRNMMLLMV